MPIYDEKQKKYYKTRKEVLQIFRQEERKKCECSVEVWAGVLNKRHCLNCERKKNLLKELECKEFFKSNKNVQYWKIRRQGRYKELKLAAVKYQPDFVGWVTLPPEEKEISLELTLPQEKIDKLVQDMHLFNEESDHGWDEE